MSLLQRFWRFLWKKPNTYTPKEPVRLQGLALMMDNEARDVFRYGYIDRSIDESQQATVVTEFDTVGEPDGVRINGVFCPFDPAVSLHKTPSGVEPREFESDAGPVVKP